MFQIIKQTFLNTFTTVTPVTVKQFKRQPLSERQKLAAKQYDEDMNDIWLSLHQKYQNSKNPSTYLQARNLARNSSGKFQKKF